MVSSKISLLMTGSSYAAEKTAFLRRCAPVHDMWHGEDCQVESNYPLMNLLEDTFLRSDEDNFQQSCYF